MTATMTVDLALADPDLAGCDAYIATLRSARARAFAEALVRYYRHYGSAYPSPWPSDVGVGATVAPAIYANVAYYLTGKGERYGRVPKRHQGRGR